MDDSKKSEIERFLSAMENILPDVFARHALTNLSGGLINSRTIANKNSLGHGPPFIRSSKVIGFEKSSFLKWLKDDLLKTAAKRK